MRYRISRAAIPASLLAAFLIVAATLAQPGPAAGQMPLDHLPIIAVYDNSRVAPLNRTERYRIGVFPKVPYAHHLGVRVGANLSLNSHCAAPDRRDELIVSLGWRLDPREVHYPVAVWGCAVGGADSSRTIEARIWTTEDNTPPTDFDNPAPDDFASEVLTVEHIPAADIPHRHSRLLLAANKHLFLTGMTLYRTPTTLGIPPGSAPSPHGRVDLEITAISPLQSIRPAGAYGRPDVDWRHNVQDVEFPMGKRVTGNLNLDWWTPPPPEPPSRVIDLDNPFEQLTYPLMAIDHPVGADGREYDLVGVRLYWQYQLDVPQQRYSDVRAVMQESLKGSLDIPRDMFLLPDWPTFTRPDGGLPTMHYADTHGNTILDLELLGSFCAKAEGVELETVTIRPDRLTGTVVYDCNFTTDNPEGLLPVGAFALNELTLNGNPLHRFNRFVRAKPVAAYGVLTVQVAPGPTPPAWADVTSHSFPLPSGSLSLFNTLHANFDVPLDPGTDLTGEYPTHFVRMSLALTHDLEIPYNKHAVQGYGLPSRRLAFRTVPQSSNTTINSCDLRTSLVSNTFTPPQPPPPAPPIPDVTQTSVRCWAEYEQTTVVTPARWELLTDPGLAAPLIQASTIISNSRFITPNPFVIATDFHVPSLARINDEILNYPDTNDITTPRPASLDRPPYTSPVISRPDPNPVALQVGERAIVSLSIMGMDPTANYDITVTYPTVVATDARCSSRTLTDTVTTGSPDNVGAYALNIAVHACPTPGTGTATANINVSLVESAITRAQLDIPISVQRYSTPTIDLNVSNTNVSYGDATDISVEVRGLNPAREYAVFVTLPSGLRFNPGCTGSFSTTLPIRRYTITHYDSVRAYGCAAGTGSVNAALRLVIPSGANPGSDAHSAASLAEQLLIRYDPAQNNQVYFDAD